MGSQDPSGETTGTARGKCGSVGKDRTREIKKPIESAASRRPEVEFKGDAGLASIEQFSRTHACTHTQLYR